MLEKVFSRLDPAWQAKVDPSRMLWVGVDISSRQHEACVGTSDRVLRRRLAIANTRDGLSLHLRIGRCQSGVVPSILAVAVATVLVHRGTEGVTMSDYSVA